MVVGCCDSVSPWRLLIGGCRADLCLGLAIRIWICWIMNSAAPARMEGRKEYMTSLTRTRYLMGNPYAAAIKHGGGSGCSVDRAGVLWPPAIMKSLWPLLVLVLIRPAWSPASHAKSSHFSRLPFHSNP